MGLSYGDAKRLGIGHLHPAECGEIRPNSGGIVLPPHGPTRPDDGMNKTERAFAEMLDLANVAAWWREPMKLRLAGRTWYMPDFLVLPRSTATYESRLTFVEVKGFMRDDAAVKLKVAAEMFPCFCWLLVRREGRHGWAGWLVTRTGIGTGTRPMHIPWIQG